MINFNNHFNIPPLHCITVHCITLLCLPCLALPYLTLLYFRLHSIALHYSTLHNITLHYITLHYITLPYITLLIFSHLGLQTFYLFYFSLPSLHATAPPFTFHDFPKVLSTTLYLFSPCRPFP